MCFRFLTIVHGATLSSELKNKNCSSVVCSVVATILTYYLLTLCTAGLFLRNIFFFEERTLELNLLGDLLTFFQWDLSLSLDILLDFFCLSGKCSSSLFPGLKKP